MDFDTEVARPGVAVVRGSGRMNMVAAQQVRGVIADAVDGGNTKVVVDLSDVSFIDSSGLGALIASLKTARQAGGDLRIAAPSEQVRTVLQLTNLDRVLRPHDSVEDAIGAW